VRFCLTMTQLQGHDHSSIAPTGWRRCWRERARRAGEIVVLRWPGGSRPASRVLVRARKAEGGAPTRLAAGLVLHEPDGRFTPAAEAILRDGVGLML
jgi:hypothetical protein